MVECTYCGVYANALDHIIPVSYDELSRKTAKYSKENTVPACNECNSHLSNLWYPSISERAGYLIEKYNQKYNKLLNQPEWEDWEIEELGVNLKRRVLSNRKKKKLIEERLEHLFNIFKQENLTSYDIWDNYSDSILSKFKW